MSIRPIFLHLQSGEGMDNRFDTLAMVNGSIAACCTIVHALGYEPLAIDEAYPGPEFLRTRVRQEIEMALRKGDTPVVFASVLSYNAEASVALLCELKAEYGARIRVGVGGQLVRCAPKAYLRYDWLDHVGIGDAEVVLPRLLAGERLAAGYLLNQRGGSLIQIGSGAQRHYARLSYDWYCGIEERLAEMQQMPSHGPLATVRQLVCESVRGCAWAYKRGTCWFCSLEGMGKKPVFKPLAEHFAIQRELVARYRLNWLFDVSNQWLPAYGSEGIAWLEQYLAVRERCTAPDVNVYTYLTSNSLTPRTAPLLRQAGVRVAYVGLDGWNEDTWRAHGKSRNTAVALESAKKAGIAIRASVVIGDGLTSEGLAELPGYVDWLLREYEVLTLGVFLEIILPGSPVWHQFKCIAHQRGLWEVQTLYRKFYECGYLSWDDEVALTRHFIDATQSVSYEEAAAVRDHVERMVVVSGKAVATTMEHGGTLPGR